MECISDMETYKIYTKIKKLASKQNITVKELENQYNFSNGTIGSWNEKSPKIDKLILIADYFNVSLDYFCKDDEIDKESLKIDLRRKLSTLSDEQRDIIKGVTTALNINNKNSRFLKKDSAKDTIFINYLYSTTPYLHDDYNFYDRITSIMNLKQMELARLSKRSNIKVATIQGWKSVTPTADQILRIAGALNVKMNELVFNYTLITADIITLADEIEKLDSNPNHINLIISLIKTFRRNALPMQERSF